MIEWPLNHKVLFGHVTRPITNSYNGEEYALTRTAAKTIVFIGKREVEPYQLSIGNSMFVKLCI